MDEISQCLSQFKFNKEKLVHVALDGPNVNQSLLGMFKRDGFVIADIGTCPVHLIYTSYRNAIVKLPEGDGR